MISIRDTSTNGKHLRQVLNHSVLGPIFRQFTLSRTADEGVLFLDALAAIPRPLWDGVDADYRAQSVIVSNLYAYFLSVGAMKAVHISCEARAKLEMYMRIRSHPLPPLREMYAGVMREVFTDLKSNNLFYDFCSYNRLAGAYVNDSAASVLRELIANPVHLKAIREKLGRDLRSRAQLRFAHMVGDPSVSYDVIISRFFSPWAITAWDIIPSVYVTAILNDDWDCAFDDARDDCLRELAAVPVIMAYVKRVVTN